MSKLILLFGLLGFASNIPVNIQVEDASGAAVKNELVIVQDLENHEREVLRVLSDLNGQVPQLDLKAGLYRAIATNPYGVWNTEVREFLVKQSPVKLVLKVEPMGSHGNGDIVTIGAPDAELQVLSADGQPARGATILARDKEASLHLERWYKTDANGMAKIELVDSPTIVVVVYREQITTKQVPRETAHLIIHLTGD
jgi:hypothetical protein